MHVEGVKSNPKLIEACKAWDRVTERFREAGLYSFEDIQPLKCKIVGNEAEYTVGSAPGHRTHIDLDRDTLEYYDDDRFVNDIMNFLLTEIAGLKCKLHSEGVTCTGVRGNEKKASIVLAAATSMDIRLVSERWIERWAGAIDKELVTREQAYECEYRTTRENREKCMLESVLRKMVEEER